MRILSLTLVIGVTIPAAAPAQNAMAPLFDDGELFVHSTAAAVTAPARWKRSDVIALPVVAAALVAVSALDQSGRTLMRRNQSAALDDVVEWVEPLGTVSNYKILGAFYVVGLLTNDRTARAVAAEGVASSLVAGALITPVIQLLVGRSRPRTDADPYTFNALSGHHSFPSGHTTQAFAVASVIATEYDQWWVKTGAYGLAAIVGLGRMYDDAHYLSDAVTAGVIGTLVGRTIVHQRHKRPANKTTQKGSR